MRYWMALVYLRDHLIINQTQQLSLDCLTLALACTKRNTQLVIKRLVAEQIITWQAGVGRGHLPKITLLVPVQNLLEQQANLLLQDNKVDQAITLVCHADRDSFLAKYISQYQSQAQQDILKIPFYRGTHSLDPINISRRTEQHIASYLYAKLLNFDTEKQTYIGDLALSWELKENCFSVTLRKQLRFHDNSPLRAIDVSNHFQRLIESNNDNAQIYQQISHVEVVNLLQINFYSDTIASAMPKLLSLIPMAISKVTTQGLVGSGSFQLTTQNQWLTRLTAFNHYHGYRAWVDAVDIWNVGDKAKSFTQDNHAHHTCSKSVPDGFNEKQQWENGAEYLLINSNNIWGKQHSQRQILMAIIQAIGLPQSIINDDVAHATSMISTPISGCKQQPLPIPNKQAAITALSDINHAQKPLLILTYQLSQHIEYAQFLCQQLNQLGMKSNYQVLEFPEFNKTDNLSKADIIISGEVFSQDVEISWLDWLYSSSALKSCLTTRFQQRLQQNVLSTLQCHTLNQRLDGFNKIENDLLNQQVYLPLFHVKQSMNISEHVSTAELLANGWIDFNTIVLNQAKGC